MKESYFARINQLLSHNEKCKLKHNGTCDIILQVTEIK